MDNQVEKFMVKTLANKVSHLERKVKELENSRSWKITSPLRFIKNISKSQPNKSLIDESSVMIENFINSKRQSLSHPSLVFLVKRKLPRHFQ